VAGVGTTISALPRTAILRAAQSPFLQRLVRRYGMRLGAARFVAGETLDECVAVLRELNATGLRANTTLLGEAVLDSDGATGVAIEYEHVLDRLAAEQLRANVALKLTHLGLSLDEDLAAGNLERVVAHADTLGSFVRVDMEQSAYVDATLRIYERLRAAGHANVGTVLQSYLRRSPDDLERVLPLQPNLRIVKGAYLEPASIALPEKRDVDLAYVRLVERGLRGGAYVAVATHDERIIRHVQAFAAREGVPGERYEFQMLYGVRPALQRSLAGQGYEVLVATPYGPDWYPYLMRRLAERPANLLFFLRNLVRR
jgi:proline dehydrogenase